MENLKQDLELLFELQSYDIKIEKIDEQIKAAPSKIEEKKVELEERRVETEAKKKGFVELSSLRKEKEAELDAREKAVAKHSVELNSVKSNDAYKALITEIEKAKADKSIIEDEILNILMKIDEESVAVKKTEAEFKEFENKVKSEITEIENSAKKAEQDIKDIEAQRDQHKTKVNQTVLSQYERIREGRGGEGICLIENGHCSSCGIILRPQTLNEVQKCSDLVFCDSCSRILLLKG